MRKFDALTAVIMEDPTFRAPQCQRKSEAGEYELQFHSLLTRHRMETNGHLLRLHFPQQKGPPVPFWVGDSFGYRVGLDVLEERKI